MKSRSENTSGPELAKVIVQPAIVDEKDVSNQVENSAPIIIGMPEVLRNMTLQERKKLDVKLRQKIDLRLVPFMLLMYILNYLDRNNIASAKLAGLVTDLNLTGSEFQTAVSILFVGYLLMQVPSNMFLNKLGKPALYLPACMVVWGLISGLTGAVHSYSGLLACRFFLGFVEAAYFPGCLFYLSSWYTRSELALRCAILYGGSLMSGAFSGLFAAGITSGMNGVRGLSAWRWLFIIEGIMTVVVACAAFFVLPNFPRTTTWLSEKEKAMAVWRLAEDIGQDDWVSSEDQSLWKGAVLAAKDIKAWVLLVIIFSFCSSGTVTIFFPIVVGTLGFSTVNTLLLTSPPYVLGTIIILVNAWNADRTRERYLHVIWGPIVGIVMYIIAMTTNSFGPRYFAMLVMVGANFAGYCVSLGWISNVLPRPPAKRAAALAGINALSNACGIYASYLYPNDGAPHYVLAMCFNIGTSCLSIIGATVLRIILTRENKKLAQGAVIGPDGTLVMPQADEEGIVQADTGFRFLV